TEYILRTAQLGTQLDPPAHWAPEYPAIDELCAMRPLVVISIVERLKTNSNYALQVSDIEAREKEHSRIPEGSVVFVRSDGRRRGFGRGSCAAHVGKSPLAAQPTDSARSLASSSLTNQAPLLLRRPAERSVSAGSPRMNR